MIARARFGSVGTLLRLRIRRDRIQLIVWVATFAFMALLVPAAVTSSYGTVASRGEVLKLVIQTPSVLMLRGTPQGTAADAFAFFLIFGFLGVLIGLMNTFLAVRHTRAEEESGRAEIIGATTASRYEPLLATALEGTLLSMLIGLVSALGYLLSGASVAGSVLAGAALFAVGIAFLGVGLFCAQLMRTSRGANGLAAAIVALAYVLRGFGDATGTVQADGLSMTTGWASWLSPIGWGAAALPFTHPTAAPLLLCLGLGVVLCVASLGLQSRRDIDSSIVPERAGRLTAPATLSGPLGLAWRMLRNSIAGWMLGAGLLGVLIGSLGQTIADFSSQNTTGPVSIENELNALAGGGSAGSIVDVFTVAMFGIVGAIAAMAALAAIVRARHDESGGTAELLLATSLTRLRWFASHLALGALTAAAVVAAALSGSVIGLTRTPGFGDRVVVVCQAALVQLPAVLVLLAAAALVFAVVPRFTVGLGWGILLVAIFIGQFGLLFGLPDAVRNASPFTHTPVVTARDADWSGLWWMLALALVLSMAAALLVRHRDLVLSA